jgi:hypothetical protein
MCHIHRGMTYHRPGVRSIRRTREMIYAILTSVFKGGSFRPDGSARVFRTLNTDSLPSWESASSW